MGIDRALGVHQRFAVNRVPAKIGLCRIGYVVALRPMT